MDTEHQSLRPVTWLLAILLCLYASGLAAAISTTINYQGYLTDSVGVPENSSLSAVFSLYSVSTSGGSIWTEAHDFNVTNGLFQVELGSVTPFPAGLFNNPLYLGIAIDPDPEMVPRLKLSSVPTAFVADGTVACTVGQTNCDGTCTDVKTDEANCGTCGIVCASGDTCVTGSCQFSPDNDNDDFTVGDGDCNDDDPDIHPNAQEVCNGIDDNCNSEIDIDTDPALLDSDLNNCGSCGNLCGDANSCTDDGCTAGQCAYDAAAENGNACDDGLACTSTDICSSGVCEGTANCEPLSCQDAACSPDGCGLTLKSGFCLIAGACYADGAANPVNGECQVCDASADAANWTNKSGSCDDSNLCTFSDVCDGGGTCGGTAYSCFDGLACTVDQCTGSGSCDNTVVAGSCSIAGACYSDGTLNPANDCQACDASASQTDWTNLANGATCSGGVCSTGVCE